MSLSLISKLYSSESEDETEGEEVDKQNDEWREKVDTCGIAPLKNKRAKQSTLTATNSADSNRQTDSVFVQLPNNDGETYSPPQNLNEAEVTNGYQEKMPNDEGSKALRSDWLWTSWRKPRHSCRKREKTKRKKRKSRRRKMKRLSKQAFEYQQTCHAISGEIPVVLPVAEPSNDKVHESVNEAVESEPDEVENETSSIMTARIRETIPISSEIGDLEEEVNIVPGTSQPSKTDKTARMSESEKRPFRLGLIPESADFIKNLSTRIRTNSDKNTVETPFQDKTVEICREPSVNNAEGDSLNPTERGMEETEIPLVTISDAHTFFTHDSLETNSVTFADVLDVNKELKYGNEIAIVFKGADGEMESRNLRNTKIRTRSKNHPAHKKRSGATSTGKFLPLQIQSVSGKDCHVLLTRCDNLITSNHEVNSAGIRTSPTTKNICKRNTSEDKNLRDTTIPLKPHSCTICPKTFSTSHQADVHFITHLGIKPYECQHCLKRFSQTSSLNTHIHTVHLNEKKHLCPKCPKRFATKWNLEIHLTIHTGKRAYKCPICSKSYRDAMSLKRHNMTVHSHERRYQCPFCSNSFSSSQALSRHLLTHTKETPYQCQRCPRAFSQASTLGRHVRSVHNRERNFGCLTCPKRFFCSRDLKNHDKIHKGARP